MGDSNDSNTSTDVSTSPTSSASSPRTEHEELTSTGTTTPAPHDASSTNGKVAHNSETSSTNNLNGTSGAPQPPPAPPTNNDIGKASLNNKKKQPSTQSIDPSAGTRSIKMILPFIAKKKGSEKSKTKGKGKEKSEDGSATEENRDRSTSSADEESTVPDSKPKRALSEWSGIQEAASADDKDDLPKMTSEIDAAKKNKIEQALGEWSGGAAATPKQSKEKKKEKGKDKGEKGKDKTKDKTKDKVSKKEKGKDKVDDVPVAEKPPKKEKEKDKDKGKEKGVVQDESKTPIVVGAGGLIQGKKESKEHQKLRLLSTMEIDLSKQQISKVPDDLVKHLNLKVLNLSTNRLTSIPTFAFSSLTTLLMDHNQLTEFPSKSFSHMPKLVLLDLSHNALESVPKDIGTLSCLKSLRLDNNQISSLPDLGKMKSLERLNVENNKIKHLSKSLGLHHATSLTSINLSHNALTSLPQFPPSVTELLLHSNQLVDISAESFSLATSLKRLHLGSNQLATFPSALYNLIQLQALYLDNNVLEDIVPLPISPSAAIGINKMMSLKQLDLSKNKLKTIPALFGQLTNLERLILAENKLTSLPPELSSLPRLYYLDVEENPTLDQSTVPKLKSKEEVMNDISTNANKSTESSSSTSASVSTPSPEASSESSSSAYAHNPSISALLAPLNMPKDDPIPAKVYVDLEKIKLFKDIGTAADMNRVGLARGKKDQLKRRNRQILHKMEDDYIVYAPLFGDETKALFCLFDGHAGPETANAAVELFPQELEKRAKGLDPNSADMSQILHDTFLAVDDALKQDHQCVGATATVVMIWSVGENRYMQAANLGDSFAFLCRNNEPILLTQEHKLSIPSEFQRILDSGVQLAPGQTRINGLAVTRALGDHFAKENGSGMIAEPSLSPIYQLTPEDEYFMLASDGLWDSISGVSALSIIKETEGTCQDKADTLLKKCLSHESCMDNIAIIIVQL
eukprot:TRINITY_DN8237_c0_g1_i1.p1 TRINITY_DN8237_c0_g1~~TRINITY_DN8237_c0_g1_i1.p1  ORF type:complete len:970 (-),score=239.15 TRINITY_DN8237_c0_g1_i1:45-2954(-)